MIEPEIKLVFACLLPLMVLADLSNGHAVLPAFVLGLVMSRHYAEHREEQKRLRVVAFAFLTPFFFIKGGLNVSLAAVVRISACSLSCSRRRCSRRSPSSTRSLGAPTAVTRAFTTLLMSTGLTFGTISSLYGLNAGIIDKTQFSLLVTVVVLSAVVPTAIAERWFLPDAERGAAHPSPSCRRGVRGVRLSARTSLQHTSASRHRDRRVEAPRAFRSDRPS